jgi:S-formylglutathione hydrolase FrmB
VTGREERGLSRRSLLAGTAGALAALGGAGWLVEEDVLPGRTRAYEVLGLNGDGAPIPDVAPGAKVDGSFSSAARGGIEVGWSVVYPPGHRPGASLPVLLMLHGASGDHTTATTSLGVDRFLALVCGDGTPPFAVATADGGSSYWRPQPDGTDASRMLLDELLPLLARQGLDTRVLAAGGWSMGGYGALRLAADALLPLRAVTALSPALGPDDGVTDRPELLGEVPLRIDCGRGDPFYPHVRDFVDSLDPRPPSSFGAGGHTFEYWRTVVADQLRFVGEHLGAG